MYHNVNLLRMYQITQSAVFRQEGVMWFLTLSWAKLLVEEGLLRMWLLTAA